MSTSAPGTIIAVHLDVAPAEVPAFEDAMGADAMAVSTQEVAGGAAHRITAYFWQPPGSELTARVVAVAAALGRADTPELHLSEVPPQDWVAQSLADFPPVEAGRYWVAGSHIGEAPRDGRIAIRIDATIAFGTGHHGTTEGCLLALDQVARHMPAPRTALDVGTGTGILAIAAARSFPSLYGRIGRVLATDIDRDAITIARGNLHRNGVAQAVHVARANGAAGPAVRARSPFDLVIANILARPLRELAPGIAAHTAPGGYVILAGLLTRQARRIQNRYRAEGLVLCQRIVRHGWTTLILRKPAGRPALIPRRR